MIGLWSDGFEVEDEKSQAKKISKKLSQSSSDTNESIEKVLKSKKLSVLDRLNLINREVDRVLGHYRDTTLIVKSREELHNYITKAIENKIIAIDTETNNSVDTITCKIMGLCLYTPGQLQAYIPINHTTLNGERLDWQINENDVKEELERLGDTFTILHNAGFDYQVLKQTCNVEIKISWDTIVGAELVDENKYKADDATTRLKYLYTHLIDTTQEEYDIEELFNGVPYAIVDPCVFGLYSAADPYMTYKLYEWEMKHFNAIGNENHKKLADNVEMPIVKVVAKMEQYGIEIDQEYAKRLSEKYHKDIDALQKEIDDELNNLKPEIDKWRLTPEANNKESTKDKSGNIKYKKSKSEQLTWPLNLDSPIQLSILLYDVLKSPVIDKDSPRGTGADIIEQMKFPICKLICKMKEINKLCRDFIDSLPTKTNIDNRIHCSFFQLGAKTGRFSSKHPNLQQIPSHAKEIRRMFKAGTREHIVESDSDMFEVPYTDEVETSNGYVLVKNLKIGDKLIIDEKEEVLKNISCINNNVYQLYI